MTELLQATRITFGELAERCKVHYQTIWSWASRGIGGHVMPSWKFAGRRVTTEVAFESWLREINGQPIHRETTRQAERALRTAERRAEKLGV